MRWIHHLLLDDWHARRAFPPAVLAAIERCTAHSERRHRGELRFVVEGGLPLGVLLARQGSRQRALELFGRLGVWDTEDNAGVLVYVLLADRRVEIVADRGIDAKVGHTAWETICGSMQQAFATGAFEQGAVLGLEAISDLLALHFPPRGDNPNELPDAPVML